MRKQSFDFFLHGLLLNRNTIDDPFLKLIIKTKFQSFMEDSVVSLLPLCLIKEGFLLAILLACLRSQPDKLQLLLDLDLLPFLVVQVIVFG